MSTLRELNTNETIDQQTLDAESRIDSWSDDELFDNMLDIINENFVMEVEASLRTRT